MPPIAHFATILYSGGEDNLMERRLNLLMAGMTRKSSLDPETGETKYEYFFDGLACPTVEVVSPRAKQYIAYDLIRHDLSCAKEWIEMAYGILRRREDSQSTTAVDVYLPVEDIGHGKLVMALFISSVTYYGKCFTQAKGRGVKLEYKTHVPAPFIETHDRIMEFRNTIAAHSGRGGWDTGRLKYVSSPFLDVDNEPFVWSELKMLSFFDDRDDHHPYAKLIELLSSKVTIKIEQLGKQILDEAQAITD